jgi:ATP-dependent protease ClpP protease subunit
MLKPILAIALVLVMLFFINANSQALTKRRNISLTERNTLILETEITPASVDTFVKAMIGARAMLPDKEILYVIIASPGGDYNVGQLVMNVMKELPNTQLICKYCASMAGEIFVATGNRRLVIDKSIILMHEMYMPHMTAENSKNPSILLQLRTQSDEFNAAHYKIIGISKEAYEKKIVGKEWVVKGVDALKWHLADEIVDLTCNDWVKAIAPETCKPATSEDGE